MPIIKMQFFKFFNIFILRHIIDLSFEEKNHNIKNKWRIFLKVRHFALSNLFHYILNLFGNAFK